MSVSAEGGSNDNIADYGDDHDDDEVDGGGVGCWGEGGHPLSGVGEVVKCKGGEMSAPDVGDPTATAAIHGWASAWRAVRRSVGLTRRRPRMRSLASSDTPFHTLALKLYVAALIDCSSFPSSKGGVPLQTATSKMAPKCEIGKRRGSIDSIHS